MKGTSVAMKAELGLPLARLALCWKITPVVGSVVTFTDHDVAITDPADGLTYDPIAGGSQSDVTTDVSLGADNLNVDGALLSPAPTLATIRAGDWDFAFVQLFYLCWADPSKGRHFLRSGNVGELSAKLSHFSSEFRGLLQYITTSFGKLTQPGCRHRFGDLDPDTGLGCNADGTTDLAFFNTPGVVDSISADGTVINSSDLTEPSPAAGESGAFAFGTLRMDDGLNAGRSREIKSYVMGQVTLHLPFSYVVSPGDAFTAFQGCDGLMDTCIDRFDNMVNFDGEPYLPGTDKMLAVARSK